MKRAAIVVSHTGKRFFLVLITVLTFAGLGFSQPKVTLGTKVGPPTTQVLVSGSGFGAYAAIDIYFDTTDEALALANSSGAFSKVPIQAPSSAVPGDHWVSAVQRSNGTGAQVVFLVQTNWAAFRFSPKHKGVNSYENVLSPTTVGQIDVDWSFLAAAESDSSPAVANGVVYFGSYDKNLYALNATTGVLLWKYATGSPISYSSPAVANGTVYIASQDKNLYALNATSGVLLWKYTTGGDINSSPTVANGVVYLTSYDDYIYALNATTGALLWKYTTGVSLVSSPAVANGVVYFGSTYPDDSLYAFNATTGAYLWKYTTGNAVLSSPAVADGVVYFTSYDNNLYALNGATGALLWHYAAATEIFSSPAVADGVVYFGSTTHSGAFYAVEAGTGELIWMYNTLVPEGIDSSPAVANGVVYFGSGNGSIYALDVFLGSLQWEYTTGGSVESSPAVANGVVYFASEDDNLYAADLTGGGMAEKFKAPSRPDPSLLRPNMKLQPSAPVK